MMKQRKSAKVVVPKIYDKKILLTRHLTSEEMENVM